jgi:hypothetical protein
VNDFIPGKNQGRARFPPAAQLNGDFSDLLRLPNPAQYQIYDPLTVGAIRIIRTGSSRSVPEQRHSGEPHREPALRL